jgi:hypothetical protein
MLVKSIRCDNCTAPGLCNYKSSQWTTYAGYSITINATNSASFRPIVLMYPFVCDVVGGLTSPRNSTDLKPNGCVLPTINWSSDNNSFSISTVNQTDYFNISLMNSGRTSVQHWRVGESSANKYQGEPSYLNKTKGTQCQFSRQPLASWYEYPCPTAAPTAAPTKKNEDKKDEKKDDQTMIIAIASAAATAILLAGGVVIYFKCWKPKHHINSGATNAQMSRVSVHSTKTFN